MVGQVVKKMDYVCVALLVYCLLGVVCSDSLSDRPPSTYVMNVESFSSLVRTQAETYLSDVFQSGGYTWTLILYPSGNKKENGVDHVSLYLGINNTNALPQNWEVYAQVRFFVRNKQQNKYYTVQDPEAWRFDGSRTEWGIARIMPLATFKDTGKGYLVGDSCEFGVDVLVIQQSHVSERLSFIKNPAEGKFTWRISDFSKKDKSQFYFSDKFPYGGINWKLQIAPGGDGEGWGKSLSIYMMLWDSGTLRPNEKVYARGKLRVLNEIQSKNREGEVNLWFSKSVPAWGYRNFMPLEDLRDTSKGFVPKDRLTLEVEMEEVSKTYYSP